MDELVRADLGRRAFDDHPAVVHHRHVLGDRQRDVHVVLDQDQRDRRGRAQRASRVRLDPLRAREPGRRLVEHHQLRLARRAPSRPRAGAARRARGRGRATASRSAESHPLGGSRACARIRRRGRAGATGRRCPPSTPTTEGRGCPRPTGRGRVATSGTCGSSPSPTRLRAGRTVTSCPNSSIVPVARRELARDHVEERGLPGPVRAEDRPALAVRDVEVDVAHGLHAAEAPADPPQAEDRLGAFGCRCGYGPTSRRSGRYPRSPSYSTVDVQLPRRRTPGSRGRESASSR